MKAKYETENYRSTHLPKSDTKGNHEKECGPVRNEILYIKRYMH